MSRQEKLIKLYRYHIRLEKTSNFGDSPEAENLRLVALVFIQRAKWKIITGALFYL